MDFRTFSTVLLVLASTPAFAQTESHISHTDSHHRPSKAELDAAVQAAQAAAAPDQGPPVHDVLYYHSTPADRSRWGDGAGPYYPVAAQDFGLSGIAVMKCTVATDGKLSDCTVLADAPKNFGFGSAAVRMAWHGFLTTKPRPEATEAEDGRVVVPFEWRPPPRD